jgi:hypothetical protein
MALWHDPMGGGFNQNSFSAIEPFSISGKLLSQINGTLSRK